MLIFVFIIIFTFLLSGCGFRSDTKVSDSTPSDRTANTNLPEMTFDPTAAATAEAYNTPAAEVTATPTTKTKDDDLVRVRDFIPSVYVELKYASEDNFTGRVIYDFDDAYLRYGTVKKLIQVQNELIELGYFLKIWDAYRPVRAQFVLWDICPDPAYVADPNKGYSNHSRGNTVDVTLVKSDGTEVIMPTGFDDFTAKADRDYSDVSEEAANNALLLENIMSAHGFNCYFGEWWHFSDSTHYAVIDG